MEPFGRTERWASWAPHLTAARFDMLAEERAAGSGQRPWRSHGFPARDSLAGRSLVRVHHFNVRSLWWPGEIRGRAPIAPSGHWRTRHPPQGDYRRSSAARGDRVIVTVTLGKAGIDKRLAVRSSLEAGHLVREDHRQVLSRIGRAEHPPGTFEWKSPGLSMRALAFAVTGRS
jgi:hypothetical protein